MNAQTLEAYTFDYLISQALAEVPNTIDKRQGSIIYDALAPACYLLADFYMQLRNLYLDTFIGTATGEELDMRVLERGVYRYAATKAIKLAEFIDSNGDPISINIGSRFSTIAETSSLIYKVIAQYTESGSPISGSYLLECETSGTAGNSYTGPLLSVSFVRGLAEATMSSLVTAARDIETDDSLRSRFLQIITDIPFGGNVSQYRLMLKEIAGIGDVQVYPVWDGGGTVKCSIIDNALAPVSSSFIDEVQLLVDPSGLGEGLGLAPIDHKVTIVTPEEETIDIAATVSLASGFSILQIQSAVESAIQSYINELIAQWGTPDELNNYSVIILIAQLIVRILSVNGITNVSALTINLAATDYTLTQTSTTQQIPVLGTVTLSE